MELTNDLALCTQAGCVHGNTDDGFGHSVAVSSDGNTVVVGASAISEAYVFVKSRFGWECPVVGCHDYVAKLVSSANFQFEDFGLSAAISADGNTIVIGANNANTFQGAAYVFVKPATGWGSSTPLIETTKLEAGNPVTGQQLGYSVAISGDGSTVVVGGMSPGFSSQGAAYVFSKPLNGWGGFNPITESAKLTASDGTDSDLFGASVATNSDGSAMVGGHHTQQSRAAALRARLTFFSSPPMAPGRAEAPPRSMPSLPPLTALLGTNWASWLR